MYLQDTWRWREFQLLLQRQSPFWNWNLTSIHSSYDFSEKRTSVLFVSVSFIVLMLISLAWLVFYYVQRFRYIHAKDRMERKLSCQAKRALAIIPTIGITQEEGDEDGNMDTCAGKEINFRIRYIVPAVTNLEILRENTLILENNYISMLCLQKKTQ